MNLLVIANDIPLPANSGGRVDVWRRLMGLKSSGFNIYLICWYDVGRTAMPSEEIINQLQQVCVLVKLIPIHRSPSEIFARLMNLWRFPSHAAARFVTSDKDKILAEVIDFKADAILLDGLYGAGLATWLRDKMQLKLYVRSHNIEHQYMLDQMKREVIFKKKIGLIANNYRLQKFETRILAEADYVFDISVEDMNFWRSIGISKIKWVPTSVDPDFALQASDLAANKTIDVLYFGNLNTPNNVEAVRWLLNDVLPRLDAHRTITLAGSKPSAEVVALVEKNKTKVKLIQNPENMAAVISAAKIIVNPMQAGSGVNLKSVEMLFTSAMLVSTPVGVKGLTLEAKNCFIVASSADDFSKAINSFEDYSICDNSRKAVRKDFSILTFGTELKRQLEVEGVL